MVEKLKSKSQSGYVKGQMQDTSVSKTESNESSEKDDSEDAKASHESSEKVEIVPNLENCQVDVKTVNEGTPIPSTYSPFQVS